jgi:hypothetical protein
MADLDQCSVCGGVHLVRRLGEIECRDCGMVCEPGPDTPLAPVGRTAGAGAASGGAASSLADDVERALDRVLGPARRTAGIR